jgi:hypothetical protein
MINFKCRGSHRGQIMMLHLLASMDPFGCPMVAEMWVQGTTRVPNPRKFYPSFRGPVAPLNRGRIW